MLTVSAAYQAALRGPHRVATRATLVDACPQFGYAPTGRRVKVLGGKVSRSATAVSASGQLVVDAAEWEAVQPYGNEVFIERGVMIGSDASGPLVEWVPLGYFRIEGGTQDSEPDGPITLTLLDRIAQVQQNSVVFPAWIDSGPSHRQVVALLVNGGSTIAGQPLYAAYPGGALPVDWTAYNPDSFILPTDLLITDSTYDPIVELLTPRKARMICQRNGRLAVVPTVAVGQPVARLVGGPNGTVIKSSRTVTRKGISNVVTAYGSDPTSPTAYVVSYNEAGPLAWNKSTHPAFGPSPRFADSPAWGTDADAQAASVQILASNARLPLARVITCSADAALDVLDPITFRIERTAADAVGVVESIEIPFDTSAMRVQVRAPSPAENTSGGWGNAWGQAWGT